MAINQHRIVLVLWLCLTAISLHIVVAYGANIPYYDDLWMVSVATGNEPLTLEWLWKAHNFHHIPLPRLLIVAAGWSGDWRWGLVASALLLSAAALAVLLALRRLRGRSAWVDLAVPMLLLGPVQWRAVTWLILSQWTLSVALTLALAAFTICRTRRYPALAAWAVGVALCGCGAGGVSLAGAPMAVAGLLAWHAFAHRHYRVGTLLATASISTLALMLVSLTGIRPIPPALSWWDFGDLFAGCLHFAAGALGTAGVDRWTVAGPLVLTLAIWSMVLGMAHARRAWAAGEHARGAALLLVALLVGALLGTAVILARSRGVVGPGNDRFHCYASLLAVLPLLIFAAVNTRFARLAAMIVLAAATAAMSVNWDAGYRLASQHAHSVRHLAADRLRDGSITVADATAYLYRPEDEPARHPPHIEHHLRLLADARLGPFTRSTYEQLARALNVTWDGVPVGALIHASRPRNVELLSDLRLAPPPKGSVLAVESTGANPSLIALKANRNTSDTLLLMDFDAPAASRMRVRYTSLAKDGSAGQLSEDIDVSAGHNRAMLALARPPAGPIRIDLGNSAGTWVFHRLELRKAASAR